MGLNNFQPSGSKDDDKDPLSSLISQSMQQHPAYRQKQSQSSIDEDFLINYNTKFKDATPILFRDEIINQTLSALISYKKPNTILVGSAGTGKTAIVEDIARRIANQDPSIPKKLLPYTIYELPLSNLVAGAGIVGELENRIKTVIDFASNPDNKAVLFIDEIHLMLSSHDSIYEKIAQILKPALARNTFKVIGATTLQESRNLDKDPAFKRRFSRILVDELTSEQTRTVLDIVTPSLVKHYNNMIQLGPSVLDEVVATADRLMTTGHRPDTALTLLDRTMAEVTIAYTNLLANNPQLPPSTAISVNQLKSIAMRLVSGHALPAHLDTDELTQEMSRIKGQDEAIEAVTKAIIRDQQSVFPRTRPLAFMFAGASGVGKSEIARILSSIVTQCDPIVLNMAEYKSDAAIQRIIGSPPGYVGYSDHNEMPFDSLETNPYRVIILDEVEKAHPAVQRLFLSALDTGEMQMANGTMVDFSRSYIIATTNAGCKIKQVSGIGFQGANTATITRRSLMKSLENHFDPEFLGRFDDVIAFQPLSEAIYREILIDCYARDRALVLSTHSNLASVIPDTIADDVLDDMVAQTYTPGQGARNAIRAVRAHIQDLTS